MEKNEVLITRTLHAPIEKVWAAWTNPENLKQWKSPEGMTTPDAAIDLHVGGKQMIHMKGPKGEDFINNGEYKEIDPMKKLVFTWQWQNDPVVSTVTVEMKKVSENETELTLIHDFPTQESMGDHEHGWESTLTKLERFLTK